VPRGYRTINIELPKRQAIAAVYTSARVADALREITEDASLYHGVRLVQVMEAVYLQGRKDGAREAFEEMDRGLAAVKSLVPHGRPGRPRKPRLAEHLVAGPPGRLSWPIGQRPRVSSNPGTKQPSSTSHLKREARRPRSFPSSRGTGSVEG